MSKKRILLTGDDGYNSLGTRLLIHFLKNDFDLTVAATKFQQSAVGGLIHITQGGSWGETTVDDVQAYWFDGSPVDAVECMSSITTKAFDCVISGVNLGANLGTCNISSGTFAAAYRGLGLGLAPHALVLSWDTPIKYFFKNHDHDTDDISDYLLYPGSTVDRVVRMIFSYDFWDVPLLNINFPQQQTDQLRWTHMSMNMRNYWASAVLDKERHTYSFPMRKNGVFEHTPMSDTKALADGAISITPCNPDMTMSSLIGTKRKKKLSL